MTGISAQHSISALNINDLNIPNQDTEKQIGSKAGNIFLFPLKKYFNTRGEKRHHLRIKGNKRVFQANGPRRQADVTAVTSDKAQLTTKLRGKIRKATSCG